MPELISVEDMKVPAATSINAPQLPDPVVNVNKDSFKKFPHTKKVGSYLLGKTLGEGSFAKVKEGLHTTTGEKVAVKVIDKKRAKGDSYVRKTFRREGRLLQMVRHKNVVQLFEIMETENSYYIVTELCENGDLMDYICKRKKLEEREVRRYIAQIISAVDYLHRAGILHRDLKIENLLLSETKDIKIIDFGLSNSVKVVPNQHDGRSQELCVTQCGSPAYAAPELLSHRKYGPQVDIWSIGVNMYAMLTGSLPFTVEPFNIKALHDKIMRGNMNPLPDHLTRACVDLIKRFLTPDPAKRISLVEAMKHPWLTEGKCKSLERPPFPNRLRSEDINGSIVKHMSEQLDFKVGDIIRNVSGNIPSPANSAYHLYLLRLTRYTTELKAKGKQIDDNLMEPAKITLMFQNKKEEAKTRNISGNGKLLSRQKNIDPAKLPTRVTQRDLDLARGNVHEGKDKRKISDIRKITGVSTSWAKDHHPPPFKEKYQIPHQSKCTSLRRTQISNEIHNFKGTDTGETPGSQSKISGTITKGKSFEKITHNNVSSTTPNKFELVKARDRHGRIFYQMGKYQVGKFQMGNRRQQQRARHPPPSLNGTMGGNSCRTVSATPITSTPVIRPASSLSVHRRAEHFNKSPTDSFRVLSPNGAVSTAEPPLVNYVSNVPESARTHSPNKGAGIRDPTTVNATVCLIQRNVVSEQTGECDSPQRDVISKDLIQVRPVPGRMVNRAQDNHKSTTLETNFTMLPEKHSRVFSKVSVEQKDKRQCLPVLPH